jgi:hypothetical protein
MCHTQFKKQKINWTLSSIFVQALISVKIQQIKKIQTHRYSLKYKKLNMQIGQLWSVVNYCVKNQSIIFHLGCKI